MESKLIQLGVCAGLCSLSAVAGAVMQRRYDNQLIGKLKQIASLQWHDIEFMLQGWASPEADEEFPQKVNERLEFTQMMIEEVNLDFQDEALYKIAEEE